MKQTILTILLVFFLIPATQADERKQQLVNLVATVDNSPLDALIIDRHVEFEMTPAAWDFILNSPDRDLASARNLGYLLRDVAYNMGWGDVQTADSNSGGKAKSPLVTNMVDSWKDKMSLKVKVDVKDPEAVEKAFEQINLLSGAFTNDYYFHPRGGKALITVLVSESAAEQSVKVSPDGNTYELVVPVHAWFSQSGAREAMAVGRAPR